MQLSLRQARLTGRTARGQSAAAVRAPSARASYSSSSRQLASAAAAAAASIVSRV